MKISEFTNILLKIKNEDDGMQLLMQEYEVTREMYKGRHPVTSKYVTIFVPHSIGQADSDIVSAAIADYHERGYSVNVMHSGSEPLKDCIRALGLPSCAQCPMTKTVSLFYGTAQSG